MPDRTLFGPDPLTLPDAQALAATLQVLADPTRLQILSLLQRHPRGMATVELSAELGNRLKQPTMSHHVKLLVEAGLVSRDWQGQFGVLKLNPSGLADALRPAGGDLR